MTDKIPPSVGGQTRIALLISDKFNIICGRQYVEKWGKRTENPFPKASNANRYNVEECFAWVQKNIIDKGVPEKDLNLMQLAAEAVARKKIRMDEQHSFEFEIQKGEYIKKREAEISAIGLAKRFLSITRDEIRAAFLKIDVRRGEELIDALDLKYHEASEE